MFEDTAAKYDLKSFLVLCVPTLGNLWIHCVLQGVEAFLGLIAVTLSFVQTQLLSLGGNFYVTLRRPPRTEDQHLRDVA
jgi:hypothetical protein